MKPEEYDHTEYELIEGVGLQSEKIYFNAENGYYYNGYGNAWRIPEVTEGKNIIEVKGNVTGDDIGLAVHSHASSDIIIDGTLKGGNNAVVLADKTVADNLKLTGRVIARLTNWKKQKRKSSTSSVWNSLKPVQHFLPKAPVNMKVIPWPTKAIMLS